MIANEALSIVCFGDYWDDRWRRRQMLMHLLSQRPEVRQVLWVEQPLTVTSLRTYLRKRAGDDAYHRWQRVLQGRSLVKQVAPKLHVVTPMALLPFQRWPLLRSLDMGARYLTHHWLLGRLTRALGVSSPVVWVSHPFMPLGAVRELRPRLLWYDCTEDFSVIESFPPTARKALKDNDQGLTRMADVVSTVSQELYQRKRQVHPRVHWLPNAVDLDLFANHSAGEVPEGLKSLPRPILVHMGGGAEHQDWDLLERVAQSRPNWSLVLIGMPHIPGPIAGRMAQFSHFRNLGDLPYPMLAPYLCHSDVCIQFYKPNAVNQSRNTQKVYWYMASGRPLVSTDTADVGVYGDVIRAASTPEGFVAQVEAALREEPGQREKRLELARANSWQRRAKEIWSIMSTFLAERAAGTSKNLPEKC